jgi:hypothetical protein
MTDEDIFDMLQRAADEAVTSGWTDDRTHAELAEALERARDDA